MSAAFKEENDSLKADLARLKAELAQATRGSTLDPAALRVTDEYIEHVRLTEELATAKGEVEAAKGEIEDLESELIVKQAYLVDPTLREGIKDLSINHLKQVVKRYQDSEQSLKEMAESDRSTALKLEAALKLVVLQFEDMQDSNDIRENWHHIARQALLEARAALEGS